MRVTRVKDFCARLTASDAGQVLPSSGVYVILNTVTMRAYIGKSKNVPNRFERHKYALRAGSHHNKALQADWTAYGEACFIFAPFAYAEDIDQLERDLIAESADTYNWDVPAPSDRSQGRKPLPPEQRLIVKSLRLTADDWAKLARLGGVEWLREKIRKAKEQT